MLSIDLSRLNENIAEECEKLFQEKMQESDGKRCIISSSMFNEIELIKPTVDAQVIINIFANISCPISCFRFAASLYPHRWPTWPIVSYEMSQAYMFEAVEIAINLRYDKKARLILGEFQKTREFVLIMQIANEMLGRLCVPSLVCSEIVEFIEQYKIVNYYNETGHQQ
ncbi:hypothetical protein Q4493_00195 [Colwellia sp. 1_MG-2023]|uniref:hypothetical protein n=1 Tax=Colwellia sp. 1_MG-2023 TaxID=3062649 RepID=UPI0026E4400C|nr:hypothetical protein [Colwellia sp. 1_MG-2023]MDO6444183.1 hypothetical protein [Colwellia sp. 1_MG-2023]